MKGMLFTFEGIDGCGKSTTIPLVAEALRSEGYDVVESCEPTKTEFGVKIRELLFNSGDIADLTTFFLFLADRAEHIAKTVAPAIEAGKVVLCDRFDLSTIVYQDLVGVSPTDTVRRVKVEASWLTLQDLDMSRIRRIWLSCDPEVAYSRVSQRGVLNRYDGASFTRFAELHRKYHYLCEGLQEFNTAVGTDNKTPAEVARITTSLILSMLESGGL